MYNGFKTTIGEVEYVVPYITLGQLRNGVLDQLKKHDELVSNGNAFEAVVIRGQIIAETLKRNYPEMDEEKVLNLLDMNNVNDIWSKVLGGSGFKPGEETAANLNGT